MSILETIIPKEIIENAKEFLPPSLEIVRDHVLKTRGMDISIPLNIYEQRVEFHQKENLNESPISWETLSMVEFELTNNEIIQYNTRLIKEQSKNISS